DRQAREAVGTRTAILEYVIGRRESRAIGSARRPHVALALQRLAKHVVADVIRSVFADDSIAEARRVGFSPHIHPRARIEMPALRFEMPERTVRRRIGIVDRKETLQ